MAVPPWIACPIMGKTSRVTAQGGEPWTRSQPQRSWLATDPLAPLKGGGTGVSQSNDSRRLTFCAQVNPPSFGKVRLPRGGRSGKRRAGYRHVQKTQARPGDARSDDAGGGRGRQSERVSRDAR